MGNAHHLKTLPVYWYAVRRGDKTFEVRKNDRDFQTGDVLFLEYYDPDKSEPYGGHVPLTFAITYILHGGQFGIEPGFVVLGLGPDETRSFAMTPTTVDPQTAGDVEKRLRAAILRAEAAEVILTDLRAKVERLEADNAGFLSALGLAVDMLMVHEPPDSRAVSNEAVALASIASGLANDECWAIVRARSALGETQ